MAPIPPLLLRRGLRLRQREDGNHEVLDHPDLLVNHSYSLRLERDLAGNAIDVFVRVAGMSFHDAMRTITAP